jgi:hypothetical protein
MAMSIHTKPFARQIQPMGLCGRLEAIRAPTRGKQEDQQATYGAADAQTAWVLRGTGEDIQRDAGYEHSHRETGKRPCQPGGGAGAYPTDPCTCALAPSVTTPLYRTTVSQALRRRNLRW